MGRRNYGAMRIRKPNGEVEVVADAIAWAESIERRKKKSEKQERVEREERAAERREALARE